MIQKQLGIILIIAALILYLLFTKIVLIWRDVMLERNEQMKNEVKNKNYE